MHRASGDEPPELVVGWASTEVTRYACERWHYAGVIPTGKLVKCGVWEAGRFVGVVVFSRGASPWLGKRWNLDHTEICELTRVALRDHVAPVSQLVARGLRMLKATNPGLRLVVSFADPARDHHGGIYQAGNWIYTGESGRTIEFYVRGRWRHVRGAYHEMRDQGFTYSTEKLDPELAKRARITRGKHRYVYPLDRAMRRRAEKAREPYPRAATPMEGRESVPLSQAGSTPRSPLRRRCNPPMTVGEE